ncbi:MoaD/ThiS family protein [Zhaonella formicivorans]|uniref:MoaD/ThiS family protein n=1 Tax=Zhaonella formicivorans TaxID=2528593 RepID=UPI001D128D01|nr:MoaD/ThiS family protein [Zhaonella formicivorans]
MRIEARFYGFFQLLLGVLQLDINLNAPAKVEDLWRHLEEHYPQFRSKDVAVIAAISLNNRKLSREEWSTTYLQDGDRVEFFTLMAGG